MAWRGYYQTFFLFGKVPHEPLWQWARWTEVAALLDPLITSSRGKASIRTTQYHKTQPGKLPFGRIGWNSAGQMKWTHESPVTAGKSNEWEFFDAEVWAPSWTICERENLAPDFYIDILNLEQPREFPTPGCLTIIAIREELAATLPAQIDTAIIELIGLSKPEICGYTRRSWRSTGGARGYRPYIQDLFPHDLITGDPSVGYSMLHPEWEMLTSDSVAMWHTHHGQEGTSEGTP